jgi:hypothetical protein
LQIHLVDGTYELFRHYYALPSARDRDGCEVAAVRGVLASLLGMIREGATHIAVATDHVIESVRNRLWPGYKTGEGIEWSATLRTGIRACRAGERSQQPLCSRNSPILNRSRQTGANGASTPPMRVPSRPLSFRNETMRCCFEGWPRSAPTSRCLTTWTNLRGTARLRRSTRLGQDSMPAITQPMPRKRFT